MVERRETLNSNTTSTQTEMEDEGRRRSAITRILILLLAIELLNLLWILSLRWGIVPISESVLVGLVIQFFDALFLTYLSYNAFLARSVQKRLSEYLEERRTLGIRIGAIVEEKDNQLSTVSQLENQGVWPELRDQILGAIGTEMKLGKSKELRNEAKWLSKKQAKNIFEDPTSSIGIWLRLLKLFNESVTTYSSKRKSLLDSGDLSTTTVSQKDYERNLENLKGLSSLTRSVITKQVTLNAFRLIKFPLLAAWIVCTNLAIVFGLGLSEFLNWWIPFDLLISGIWLALLLRPELDYRVRFATQKVSITVENLLVSTLTTAPLATVVGVFAYESVQVMPASFKSDLSVTLVNLWGDPLSRILIVVSTASLLVFLLKDATLFILERWSERLSMKYDETFVSLTQWVAATYIAIIASAILVTSFHEQLGITSPETVLLPYLFAVTLLTGILGYASRETLENFFAGVMIRMNPPFQKGDRIILESGELCDVREMGMRSVTLYNIQLNAEIYVPNRIASNMTVTNVSRPDLELRVQVPVNIRAVPGNLAKAERILMDIAYSEPEVDQMIIDDTEFGSDKAIWNRERNRFSIRDLLGNLRRIYPRVDNTKVATGEIVTNKEGAMHLTTFKDVVDEALTAISNGRKHYKRATDEQARMSCIETIMKNCQNLSNAIYSVGENLPDIKEELDALITELSKEPAVHSRPDLSPSGVPYMALKLNVFAFHLERRFEVEHKLNCAILDRLGSVGLLMA